MKIGIMTFHWATNYGAVLQAFALQRYLSINTAYETEVINYFPLSLKIKQLLSHIKHFGVSELRRELPFYRFRKSFLTMSKNAYYSSKKLKSASDRYDIYVCGSDQIWNEWFIDFSESTPNLSYYLHFVAEGRKRVSYATSFGADSLSGKNAGLIKTALLKFSGISVREDTGKALLEDMGIPSTQVVDPTLLHDKDFYEKLLEKCEYKNDVQLFSYVLHANQKTATDISDYLYEQHIKRNQGRRYSGELVEVTEWLYHIKNSCFVVTNSFHGVIFALIFNKPFIATPVENSTMNNRIVTLLNLVGLNERMMDTFDKDAIDRLVSEDIDWVTVEHEIELARKEAVAFLNKYIIN